jgi:hypothetical protein
MASKKLLRVFHHDDDTATRLAKSNLTTCKEVLSMTDLELQERLDISYSDIRRIMTQVSRSVSPAPISVCWHRTTLTLLQTIRALVG